MAIIYGGSFNPPTIAHFEIAKHIINMFPNEKFIFLPTNNFYKKENLKDFRIRVKMLDILCNKLGHKASISDFELKLDKYYGTYYTLEHFKNSYFVMGADNVLTLPKWIKYPEVVINNKFIIVPRNDIDLNKVFEDNQILKQYQENFIILNNFNKMYVSSSDYRKTLNDKYLLMEVVDFINKNKLYRD